MNKPKIAFPITAFLFVYLLSLTNSFAQTENQPKQAEPSYEIVLQTLIASNDTAVKSAVPQTLSNVVKKLKANYSFSDYHLTSTYLERVTNTANFEFKGVSSVSDQNQENYAPLFSEWSLGVLRSLPNEKGRNSIQFQRFRFGQRVPVKTSAGVVNYEQIGLTLDKLSLPENIPTIIGSLATSKPEELMFLVLTVKPVEE
jgi:hypothetical protein